MEPASARALREPVDQALWQALCVRFVGGDEEAFEEVFAHLRRDVWRVVQRFFHRAFDQEEAFQEAWLDVYRNRRQFDVNRAAALHGWVRTVARNRCLDLLAAAGVRPPAVTDDDAADLAAPEPGAGASEEIRAALERFTAALDAEERRLFTLCFVEERPHEEVARLLGISERRSKYLKKKLLARLEADPGLRSVREGT
ncbi:MAG TPA: sigma-70 family RNA polymerase sigma factor [Polyangia bacterium]|jgi:RNA polymerase sigma-70 factor (ECF subfamily)